MSHGHSNPRRKPEKLRLHIIRNADVHSGNRELCDIQADTSGHAIIETGFIQGSPGPEGLPGCQHRDDPKRELKDEDIMFALLDGDVDEITDEMFNEVKWFAQAVRDKKRRENEKNR